MSVQRVLARLGPLMVMADRDHIPSFKATAASGGKSMKERAWIDLLANVPLKALEADLFNHKRVVIFGEQHQQPQVLRAQLSVLSMLHEQAPARVVLVMEHFNFQQDDLLRRFSESSISNDAFLDEYAKSREGFQLNHYLPLLLLARELDIPVHGGFPPRQWASMVYKESIASLRQSEDKSIPEAFSETYWEKVSHISREQVAYLKSMMSGTQPKLPTDEDVPDQGDYKSGILPAQTLKDTFLAYTIDHHLRQDPATIVYAVCGLGHSEFDLCVSPRIQACQRDEMCLIASKNWLDKEYIEGDPVYTNDNKLADLVIPYDAQ